MSRGPTDAAEAAPSSPSSEAVRDILDRFESYVDDLTTRLETSDWAGTVNERTREEADQAIRDYRRQIRDSKDAAEAQEWFARFKDEARSWRP